MQNRETRESGAVCSEETLGEDFYSCRESNASSAYHLVVMVHGILGSASDWKYGAEQFVKRLPDKVVVHCSERNSAKMTLDGVNVMGERLAEEVLEVISRKPGLRQISFVAHSVGGVVARYTIGKLYQPLKMGCEEQESGNACTEESKGTIAGLEPVNFITVATPHLGSRGNKQVCFKIVPAQGGIFKYIVGWRTSSIRRNSELPKWEDYVDEKYPHIVHIEVCNPDDTKQSEPEDDDGLDELEEELLTALCCMSWEKIDVSFHSSRLRFSAHSVIQVKDPYMHSEGADVIQHIVDHFLL